MAKTFDGGISTKPFELLITEIADLQTALFELMNAVAVEEHVSSLVDDDLVKKDARRCAEITKARKAVDNSIGVTHSSKGLIKVLFECANAVKNFGHEVDRLADTYKPVIAKAGKHGC